MKMWSTQNLFILYIALRCATSKTPVISVSGYEGRDVNVSCPYEERYQSHMKYLCKNHCGNSDVLIETTTPKQEKYSIYDDKKAQIFTVTISDLHKTDAGKYWCGVSLTGTDIYTEIKVEVAPDSCCNSVTKIQSYGGYSESISCPYESQYQNNLKYICRGNQPSTCLQQALITSDNKQNGRFKLNDDKVSRRFTVTISRLSQKDSGLYLCGVERRTGGLDIFSAVELEVKVIHILVCFLPIPLAILLISTVVWVKVYKCNVYKVRAPGADIGMDRIPRNFVGAEQIQSMDHIHGNQVLEVHPNLESFEEQNNLHIYDNDGGNHVYCHITEPEDIYCY